MHHTLEWYCFRCTELQKAHQFADPSKRKISRLVSTSSDPEPTFYLPPPLLPALEISSVRMLLAPSPCPGPREKQQHHSSLEGCRHGQIARTGFLRSSSLAEITAAPGPDRVVSMTQCASGSTTAFFLNALHNLKPMGLLVIFV